MDEEEATCLSLSSATHLLLKEDQVHEVAEKTQRTLPIQRPQHDPPALVTSVEGCQAFGEEPCSRQLRTALHTRGNHTGSHVDGGPTHSPHPPQVRGCGGA